MSRKVLRKAGASVTTFGSLGIFAGTIALAIYQVPHHKNKNKVKSKHDWFVAVSYLRVEAADVLGC
jgi:hypothetical protein